MSQVGYTPILTYGSTTASNVPLAANLTTGASGVELAINATDGKLFYKDSSGVVQVLAVKMPSSILPIANGGTNATATPTSGAVAYGTGTAYAFTSAGTSGQVLQSNGASAPTWVNLSTLGVSTFSAGTTGFTPSSATSGAVTLAGTLATTNGGTGLTSFAANGVVYASSSSALTTGSALTFDGSQLAVNAAAGGINMVVSSSGNTGSRVIGGTGSGLGAYFSLQAQGTNAALIGTESAISGSGTSNNLMFYGYGSNSIIFAPATAEGMRLTSTGLGIGTSSPGVKVDAVGVYRGTFNSTSNGGPTTHGLELRQSTTSTKALIAGYSTSGNQIGAYIQAVNFGTAYEDLVIQPQGGNLGIGTSSPTAAKLHIAGYNGGSVYPIRMTSTNSGVEWAFETGGPNAASSFLAFRDIGNSAERMRLDAAGLLTVGNTSPAGSSQITAYGASNGQIAVQNSTNWSRLLQNANNLYIDNGVGGSTGNTIFRGSSSTIELMRLDSSGNLGLGVTPSAWDGGFRAVQVGVGAGFVGRNTNTEAWVTSNAVFDQTDGRWEYITTSNASAYTQMAAGQHQWYTAPSGTAGNAITFTQAMTLDASGNLGVGVTSPSYKLQVQFPSSGIGAAFRYLGGTNNPGLFFSTNESTTVSQIDASGSTSGILALATSGTERARITSGGYFKASNAGTYLGSTGDYHELRSSNDNYLLYAVNTRNGGNGPFGISVEYSAQDPNGTGNEFLQCVGISTLRAEIRSNGGLANFSANDVNLSDRREKTNFAPAKSYLDAICAIPVQTFNYIDQSEDDPGLTLGVVAQDVQAVAPELVMESNWGSKDDPKMRLSIYQTDLQYALMKCIQELKADLDATKAELAALKGA
jgi:hypothetical protein